MEHPQSEAREVGHVVGALEDRAQSAREDLSVAVPGNRNTNGRVLDVLESQEKAAVVARLKANKSGLLKELIEVTIHMWDAYAEPIGEVFGDAVA